MQLCIQLDIACLATTNQTKWILKRKGIYLEGIYVGKWAYSIE